MRTAKKTSVFAEEIKLTEIFTRKMLIIKAKHGFQCPGTSSPPIVIHIPHPHRETGVTLPKQPESAEIKHNTFGSSQR